MRRHEHDRGQHDRAQLFAARQVRQLEHGQIGVELEGRFTIEELAVSAAGPERQHRHCEAARKAVFVGHQSGNDIVDRAAPALFAPYRVDDAVDQSAFGVIKPVDVPRHLTDHGFEHRQAIELVVVVVFSRVGIDHRERIDAEPRRQGELDERPALKLARMLEAAPVVDDDDVRSCTAQRRTQLLQRHRLARSRLAEHGHIVVAGRVLERRPEERLAPPADQQQMGVVAAFVLALERGEVGGCRREHGAHPLHALEVAAQARRDRHRQTGQEADHLHVLLVVEIPPARLVHRFEDAFVGLSPALGAERGHPVERAHQFVSLAQFFLNVLPLDALFLELWQEPRRLGIGQARGPHELVGRLVLRGGRIGIDQAKRGRDRARQAQLVGEQIADQTRTVPRRPARRQIADRVRPHLEIVGIHIADLGNAVLVDTGGAQPLGSKLEPVGEVTHFHVPPDRLVGDRVEGIVGHRIVARCGRRRGDVVDQRQQINRIDHARWHIDRAQRRLDRLGQRHQLVVADTEAIWNSDRDDEPEMPQMKRRVLRQRIPYPRSQIIGPVLRHALIDACRVVARHEPFGEFGADPRRGEVDDLDDRAGRHPLPQRLRDDIGRALVCADHRRQLEGDFARAGIVKDPRFAVEAAIRKPVRKHRHGRIGPAFLAARAITDNGVEDP